MSRQSAEKNPAPKEFAQYGCLADTGVELLHARFDNHRFTTHAHDTWAIGAVLHGAHDTMTDLPQQPGVHAGEVYVIPPQIAHAGQSVGDNGCEYVMLYVPDTEWRTQCAIHGVSPDALSMPLRMPSLAALFGRFASRSLRLPHETSAWSSEWFLFCETVLGVASRRRSGGSLPASTPADRRLQRTSEYLRSVADRPVSLDELAREASLSASELCRRFTSAFGLSPHRYHLVLRLKTAKQLLLQGMTPSAVASATGFADQSHLGRHFKAVFGVTPGTMAGCNSARTF